jgi:hypothetical protein
LPRTRAGAVQRALQPLETDRLDEIVDRVRVERRERVLVVRGAEDHGGRGIDRREMPRRFESAHERHANVE